MPRTISWAWAIAALLIMESSGRGQAPDDGSIVRFRDGIVAFSNDPDCPGCRAFLTGYAGPGAVAHSPTCDCAAAPMVGESAGEGAPSADQFAGDEYQDLLASDYSAGLSYDSAAPGMIGDFFGGSYGLSIGSAGQPTTGPPGFVRPFSNVSQGGGDRRFKVADNQSPFPVDRVFFNYSHFHRALRTADFREANLNRGVAGFEKTFLDQWWSAEIRAPFSSGLNSDQVFSPTANNVSNEFGNISLAVKRLLFRNDTFAASIGCGFVLPTANETRMYNGNNSLVLVVKNESCFVQPFAGLWWTPNDRFFGQFSVQADLATSGNDVFFDGSPTRQGVMQDQNLLFVDASFGYWLFRDLASDRCITGIAPMLELHHTTTLQDTDIVSSDGTANGFDVVTNPANRLDVLNLTAGLRFELGGRSYLTLLGVTPLRTGDEHLFDAEFGAQYTRFY